MLWDKFITAEEEKITGVLTVKDLEHLQTILQENHLDYQLELRDGKIIVTALSDIVSSEIGALFCRLLGNWVYPHRLGRVFDSSGGFILPNSDLTAPDVSFVSAERLKQSPRYFGQMVPDLVVEIKSQSDRIRPLRDKIQLFLNEGARVGILIDPDRLTVTVYRLNSQPVVFVDRDILTIPELFSGWQLPISEIWPPLFE